LAPERRRRHARRIGLRPPACQMSETKPSVIKRLRACVPPPAKQPGGRGTRKGGAKGGSVVVVVVRAGVQVASILLQTRSGRLAAAAAAAAVVVGARELVGRSPLGTWKDARQALPREALGHRLAGPQLPSWGLWSQPGIDGASLEIARPSPAMRPAKYPRYPGALASIALPRPALSCLAWRCVASPLCCAAIQGRNHAPRRGVLARDNGVRTYEYYGVTYEVLRTYYICPPQSTRGNLERAGGVPKLLPARQVSATALGTVLLCSIKDSQGPSSLILCRRPHA